MQTVVDEEMGIEALIERSDALYARLDPVVGQMQKAAETLEVIPIE